MEETKTVSFVEKYLVRDNQPVMIGYKDKDSGDIFYTLDTTFNHTSNFKGEGLFLLKNEIAELKITANDIKEILPLGCGYTISDILLIYTDIYRIMSDQFQELGRSCTLDLAHTLLHLKQKQLPNSVLYIEKYFPETDEWYNIETGMTREESLISKDLVSVVNRFNKLPCHHPRHQPDMCNAVHVIQRLLQSRTCHRLFPEQWIVYDEKGNKR